HPQRRLTCMAERVCRALLAIDCQSAVDRESPRRRRCLRPAALAAALAVALAACRPAPQASSTAGDSASVAALPADVVHSWTSGGELKAIAAVADAFNARGGAWRDAAVAGFDNA